MAIESLTYELVAIYREDLDPAVLRTWEPRKVFDELLAIDPDADASMTLTIAAKGEGFEGPGAITFKEHRMSEKWARKMHGTLGGFLHERLLPQLEAGKDADLVKTARKVGEIIDELDRILASNGFKLRFRQAPKFECDCGAEIRRFIARGQKVVPASCPQCGKLFRVERKADGDFRVMEYVGSPPPTQGYPFAAWTGPNDYGSCARRLPL